MGLAVSSTDARRWLYMSTALTVAVCKIFYNTGQNPPGELQNMLQPQELT